MSSVGFLDRPQCASLVHHAHCCFHCGMAMAMIDQASASHPLSSYYWLPSLWSKQWTLICYFILYD